MKLVLPKERFVCNLLNPVSKLAENVLLTFDFSDEKQVLVKTTASSADSSVVFLAQCECEIQNKKTANCIIPDCKTFLRLFSGIDDENVELTIDDNFISYTNKKLSFKYHLLDESYLVQKKSISEEKLKQLSFDTTFNLTRQKLSEIIKFNSIVPDAEKIYFYTSKKEVIAKIGDDQKANTNEITTTISEFFEGKEVSITCPINIQNILLFSFNAENIKVAFNSQLKIFKFYTPDLQYIVSGLIK